jgi:phosphopantothenoylcysteine decarboxylase/phosphopantothenate--cysteine ligase
VNVEHRPLAGRRVVVGVTGSIAAYKAILIVRRLQDRGAEVDVVMTRSAAAFVTPLTFESLTHRPAITDVLALDAEQQIAHIELAEAADAVVIAPATANLIAELAAGLVGSALTALACASRAPVVVAPAMDAGMWTNQVTQRNVSTLRELGYRVIEPEVGALASGLTGIGRLAETATIADAVERLFVRAGDLDGLRVVVSAGGTREPIDPVRFIGNRSTGRMGAAIARAAIDRGARVTAVAGRTEVPLPDDARIVRAETTSAMRDAVLGAVVDDEADALIMAAAVADFRPVNTADTKLTRDGPLTIELEPTEDILAEVGRRAAVLDPRPFVVGFAAETGSLDRIANKLRRKGADLLVANDVTEPGSGFGSDTNRVVILAADGTREELPLLTKREVADLLLDRVAAALDERDARAHTARTARETRP